MSNTRNQRERKDRGPGVKQHSEAAPELILGGGQDDGDADDLVRPGRSRGNLGILIALRFVLTTTR